MKTLDKIKIDGFKSIEHTDLNFESLNIIIGANGSGKSNLIGVFRLLERVVSRKLQEVVASNPDRLLHHGRKHTQKMMFEFSFGVNDYGFELVVSEDTLIFAQEYVEYDGSFHNRTLLGSGLKESELKNWYENKNGRNQIPRYVYPIVDEFVVYHFHDTSDSSPAKRTCDVADNRFFARDGANLPAYLYFLQEKHPHEFQIIQEHIRLVAPFFDQFKLKPLRLNEDKIKLEWEHKGSEAYFDAYSLSDGTLRFICLATLLLQPRPPKVVLLDEPELGLHPSALSVLADMLVRASQKTQIILATQSVTLLNYFEPNNIIVANNDGIKTEFKRLENDVFQAWLEEYSIGELWEKNVLGGRP